MSWKGDLAIVGTSLAVGTAVGGAIVGAKRLNAHIVKNTPDAPPDYVSVYGNEYNKAFHVARQFCKTHEEKSFLKTIRHRLSRLIKLSFNDDRLVDTEFWKRLGTIKIRYRKIMDLIQSFQYLIKERHNNKPLPNFDDAIQIIRSVAEDINHNNVLQRTDID